MEKLKNIWNKVSSAWAWFEAKVAAFMPKAKVKIINGLGALDLTVQSIQAYLKEVPLEQVVSAKRLVITGLVLSTLSFWLRGISSRTAARVDSK